MRILSVFTIFLGNELIFNMKNKYQHAGGTPTPNSNAGIRYSKQQTLQSRHISWGAIFAGALVSLLSMIILNLLGLGIGLGTTNPAEGARLFSALSTGSIVWWMVSNLLAVFVGSYIASRLAAAPFGFTSILHGILSWCLYTLVFFWILTTSLGSLMSGVGCIVSDTFTAMVIHISPSPDITSSQKSMISMDEVKNEVKQLLRDTENMAGGSDSITTISKMSVDYNDPQHDRQNLINEVLIPEEEIEEIAREELYVNENLAKEVDRQDLANIIQDRTYLGSSESMDVADIMIRQYRKAKRDASQQEEDARRLAEENGKQVTTAASTAAVWISASLILGALMAGIGGRIAKPFTISDETPDENHL